MSGSGGWQTGVSTVPAPGVVGDFCDANPRQFLDAGPGGLVAGPLGLTVGRFAWISYVTQDADNAPASVNNFGAGVPNGFVHREQQGLNTVYLQDASMFIPPGFPVSLVTRAGLFVQNDGTAQARFGHKAYAALATGRVSFGPTGTAGTASVTGSIAANTASITGSLFQNELTVTAVASGSVAVGSFLSGTVGGSGVIAGTQIVSQISGTANGTGVYALSIPEQQVNSGALSLTYGTLTVSNVASGTVVVGGGVAGSGVSAGTTITALGTGNGGNGGNGTYIVNNTQTAASQALTVGQTVETVFSAASAGLPGELVKMSPYIQA